MPQLQSGYSNQVSAMLTADTIAPKQVTGLSYTVEQGKVILNWNAVTQNTDDSAIDDLAGYRVFRKDAAGDVFSLLGSVESLVTTYTDMTAKAGANYIYAVSAFDDEETPNVGEVSADLLVKTIPSVPTGLVSSASGVAITLNWNTVKVELDAKLNENLAGYNVYRSEVDGSGYVKIGSAAPAETTFVDSTAVQGTTYFYVITAYDNSL
ncbi:hypothetical protein FU976_08045 [Campylobacter jejuni]|nr:hypothetical protein [Campylobacter jejuni]